MEQRLYWLGNVAKTKIISDIIARVSNRHALIFDYGCGDSGDWPAILRDNSNIKLIAYEPLRRSFEIAKDRLSDLNAEVLTGDAHRNITFKADFVVSFSVLEHVYDRIAYLETAKKHLAKDGIFYLNYDDGHFRNVLDLNRPDLWFAQVKAWLHNSLATTLAKTGFVSRYQRRVTRAEIAELIETTGFRLEKSEYCNLASFKNLQKKIAKERHRDFAKLWLEVEDILNLRFAEIGALTFGDSEVLWHELSSRTLYLRLA